MDRQTSNTRSDTDQTEELARSSEVGTASVSEPASTGPVIDAGFLLENIDAP